jgi:hypothetical protein
MSAYSRETAKLSLTPSKNLICYARVSCSMDVMGYHHQTIVVYFLHPCLRYCIISDMDDNVCRSFGCCLHHVPDLFVNSALYHF